MIRICTGENLCLGNVRLEDGLKWCVLSKVLFAQGSCPALSIPANVTPLWALLRSWRMEDSGWLLAAITKPGLGTDLRFYFQTRSQRCAAFLYLMEEGRETSCLTVPEGR